MVPKVSMSTDFKLDWIELLLVVVAWKLYPLPGGKGIRTVLFFAGGKIKMKKKMDLL